MGYYFQDQLESRSWAGLGLNTNLPAERNLRAQQVIAEAEQQQVSGGHGRLGRRAPLAAAARQPARLPA